MSGAINTNDLRAFADKQSATDCEYLYAVAEALDHSRTARNISKQMNRELRDKIATLREALNIFIKCTFPASTSIDPRGYSWCEGWLDEALPIARAAIEKADQ